jgi:Uma2 family endonuclease
MASVSSPHRAKHAHDDAIPPLENGDRLTRAEFERRYDAMPGLKKAELIEGLVYMPSPVGLQRHGEPHTWIITWLGFYQASTTGVRVAADASARLDLDNMPQPDALLMIDPDHGGQSRISADDYVEGAPELVAEVSSSTASFDLNTKFEVYRRNGVREYVVWRVRDKVIDWFVLRDGEFVRLDPDENGHYRSVVFPGLWLDSAAMIRGDLAAVLERVRQGVAIVDHGKFVDQLAAASTKGDS